MRRIYLDYAASTPVRSEARKIMLPYFSDNFGNPGSLHSFGQKAMSAVDKARETIAKAINGRFREVIFTSGATEANNLALRGVARSALFASRGTGRSSAPAAEDVMRSRSHGSFGDQARESSEIFLEKHARRRISGIKNKISGHQLAISVNQRPKIIVSAIEHESVLDTAYSLEREGVEIAVLPVDKKGIVDMKKLESSLDERTVLVSVMYVNNEIGSIQPIAQIADIIRNYQNTKFEARNSKQIRSTKLKARNGISDFGFRNSDFGTTYPLFHVDAAQAFEYFNCDTAKLGVDLMTLSSQKIYGPKGTGALYVRNSRVVRHPEWSEGSLRGDSSFAGRRTQNNGKSVVSDFGFRNSDLRAVQPLVTGGGQEFGLRSGTENVPAIAGFGEAARLAEKERARNVKRVTEIRDYFWRALKKVYPPASINGNQESGRRNKGRSDTAPHILNVYFPTEFAGDLLTKMDMAGIAASSGSACSARSYAPSHVLEALHLPSERVRGSVRFSFGIYTTKAEIREAVKRMKKILE